ncbi:cysteine proteinase [Armillaria gallica]|uniref:Cysteine proteinase n=1 Tax=Armillaria gallica TaxID=47427 RepID=A0A2H3E137_ARMGA|nr:cysteine proteinase [Armillaria gallica]
MEEYPFKIWKPSNPTPRSLFPEIDEEDSTESSDSSSDDEGDFRNPCSRSNSQPFTLANFHTGLSGSLKRKAKDSAISKVHRTNTSVPGSSQEHVTEGETIDPEELMLQYPWGITGGVGIKREDFDRLKLGVYLNDNLIEFGLRLLQEQLGQDKFAINKDIYVFSPFWFPKFKRKYDDVRHWTSKINIFAMKYLIIPIHEGNHWYLAIIFNPGCMILPGEPEKETQVEAEKRSDTGKGSAAGEVTQIFTLDSLGSEHQDTLTALSNFLVLEASDKKGVQTTRQPITQSASVPRQRNSYDCGIFLLHFAETFMSEPSRYHKLMLESASHLTTDRNLVWQVDKVKTLRERLTCQIMELSKGWSAYMATHPRDVTSGDSPIESFKTRKFVDP